MVLHQSPIFGPVSSRRLGVSLGINLLPADGKVCSFDCVYCECGLNADNKPHKPLPTREDVRVALETKLREMQKNGVKPDALTFAGNGEPTLHPHFPEIVDDVRNLRDLYFPEAKITVLSNATQIHKRAVMEALCRVDEPILKLDSARQGYVSLINRPQGNFNVEKLLRHLSIAGQNIVVQTMFLCGTIDGKSVDNTSEEHVRPWLQALQRIMPKQVMVYTIARETPFGTLAKTPPERLDEIARRVEELGIRCSVSY